MPKRPWPHAVCLTLCGLFGVSALTHRSSSLCHENLVAFQSQLPIYTGAASNTNVGSLPLARHGAGGAVSSGVASLSRSWSSCAASEGFRGNNCGPLAAIPQHPQTPPRWRRTYPSWGKGDEGATGTSHSYPPYYKQQQPQEQQQRLPTTSFSSAGGARSSSSSPENARASNGSAAGQGNGGGVRGVGDGEGTQADSAATARKRAGRRRFDGLLASAFQHPFDQEATAMLRRLPGLELAIRSAVPAIEDAVYIDNIANSILVGPKQMASLHGLLVEACRILDMQVPDMYIRQNPVPNAYTLAIRGKKPFIVLHTALVDLMEPEEVQAVIAHELGHLKCEHGIWVTLATVLANGLYRGGFLGAFLANRLGLRRRLMRWSRAAEFTCDRAAMLVAQDVNIVITTLLKLAGGSIRQASELSVTEFLKQASAYELASRTRIGKILKNSSEDLTHPLPVIRARELDKFSKSTQYLVLVRRGAPL